MQDKPCRDANRRKRKAIRSVRSVECNSVIDLGVPPCLRDLRVASEPEAPCRNRKAFRMPKAGITPRAQDYAQWYLDIVAQADLADYSPVRGCMVI